MVTILMMMMCSFQGGGGNERVQRDRGDDYRLELKVDPNLSGRLESTLVLTQNNKPLVPSHSLLTGRVPTFRCKTKIENLIEGTYWPRWTPTGEKAATMSRLRLVSIKTDAREVDQNFQNNSRSGARDGLLFWSRKLRHRWVASKGSLRSGQVQYILLLWA